MIKVIVILIVVIVIFIVIAYSDYIAYFFRLLKREIKHNRRVNKLMHGGNKGKIIKNSIIKKYLQYVSSKLNENNYRVKEKYILNADLERKLKYSKFDDKYINELFKNICDYFQIDSSKIVFNIQRTSSRTQTSIAGSYQYNDKVITLQISTYTTLEQIISTLSHECSHHLLHINGLGFKDIPSNEILTDLTAIYLGFDKFFYKAYKNQSRIIYDGEYVELIDRKKLGYVGYKDVKHAAKISKKIKRHMKNKNYGC